MIKINDLRLTAEKSKNAIYSGDFKALGEAMIENTEAQSRLHPDLVSWDARRVIDIAKNFDIVGWKVNGAGGEGGSIALLCSEMSHIKRSMIQAIEQDNALFKNIPVYLSRYGLRVWEYKNTS